MELIIQYIFSGITVGSIYAIVAIGFNIIYNSTGIINFSQGEFVMLGGMIAYSLSKHMHLSIAIIIAIIITAIIGSLIELIFIRNIKESNVLKMIIVTIGISLLIREISLNIWDEKVRALPFFTGTEISSINIFGAHISPQVLWVIFITLFIVIGLIIFFKYTMIGQAMRACSSDKTAAGLCGINTNFIINLSFMLSAAIGALGGCVISPLTQTHYAMGTELAIKGFTVAILGGLGNSFAPLIAGILLGLLESFSISILPMAYKDVISLIILISILLFRPRGLFGKKQEINLKEF